MIFLQSQVVEQPTRTNPHSNYSSLIDLVLLPTTSQLKKCSVIPPLCNSDHNGIVLVLKWSQKPSPAKVCSKTIWRYTHANFNQLIFDFDWSFLEQETDVDTAWNKWEQTFITIMEHCIPKVSISARSNLPWMNYAIKRK